METKNHDGGLGNHDLTGRIIGAAITVSRTLGHGFLEGVYERALKVELASIGLRVQEQVPYKVRYKATVVGDYVADLVVEDIILVELKAVPDLAQAHRMQVLNYLRASNLEIGLLLNFGTPTLQKQRIIKK